MESKVWGSDTSLASMRIENTERHSVSSLVIVPPKFDEPRSGHFGLARRVQVLTQHILRPRNTYVGTTSKPKDP